MCFYEILQSIMEEKKISVADVARLSGLTDSTVRSILTRKNKTVALDVAFKLSKGLEVSLQRLNGESEADSRLGEASGNMAEDYSSLKDEYQIIVDTLVKQLLDLQGQKEKQ